MNDSWMIGGDFNDIVCNAKKKGGALVFLRKCQIFGDRINRAKLIDLNSVGPAYTWRGPKFNGLQRVFEWSERALSNDSWRLMFLDVVDSFCQT